ncbi:MAG: hypothetical protein HC789_16750 [Microcoleus sp. CSU_2_2]|nr:hypothetical protein [Microcoleus sp. SU_5_3]NJS11901.1 hypothetical protein [Microcoleus sp. CSU_2_2]
MKGEDSIAGLRATLWNALSLNGNFYENSPYTPRTKRIALTIVILAAVSRVLGSAVILLINRTEAPVLFLALLIDGLAVVGGYYFWTFTISKIGDWLKPGHVSYGELLIPIGFAYAPQALNFLTLIPLLGEGIERVLAVWSLLAVTVAVRQGLDIKTRWALLICLVGWPLIQIAIGFVKIIEQLLSRWL